MKPALLRRSLGIAAIAASVFLASCETPEPPAPPPPPPPPPAVALNSGIPEAASIYLAYVRDVKTITGSFQTSEAVQEALRRGAAYEPTQLSRGMVAYGAVLALQSPEFVQGVRTFAADAANRNTVITRIGSDPAYAAQLPGAEAAAGLIAAAWGEHAADLAALGAAIEEDAYTIQERDDPRRRWATQPVADRQDRLDSAKALSVAPMLPSADESARLFAAAHSGNGLELAPGRQTAPYTEEVIRSLAIAALAALGAGGEDWRSTTDSLTQTGTNEFCLSMSKLNVFQCLAASRPYYEDMFCIGRHVIGDIGRCTAQSAGVLAPNIDLPAEPTLVSAPETGPAPVTAAATVAEPVQSAVDSPM